MKKSNQRKREEKNYEQQRGVEDGQRKTGANEKEEKDVVMRPQGLLPNLEECSTRSRQWVGAAFTLTQAVQPEKPRPLIPTLPGSGHREQTKSPGRSEMQRTPEGTRGSQWGVL